jgi:hypothetical protein
MKTAGGPIYLVLTKKQQHEFAKAARPLIKFLNDNCHPYVCVVVDVDSAQIFEGVARFVTEDYLRD